MMRDIQTKALLCPSYQLHISPHNGQSCATW